LPADGEYLRPAGDFFEEDLRLELLDFFLLEELLFVLLLLRAVDFFAVDLRALLFFALLFFAEDFFALLDLFFAAFFVAIAYPPSDSDVRIVRDSCMTLRQPRTKTSLQTAKQSGFHSRE